MATVGKKKLTEIKHISVIHDVIKSEMLDDGDFVDLPPDTWDNSQKELYDLLIVHEHQIISRVVEILERKRKPK